MKRGGEYEFPPGVSGAVAQPLVPVAPAIPYGFDDRSRVARLSQGQRVTARQSSAAAPQYVQAVEHESPEYRTLLFLAGAGQAWDLSLTHRADGATIEWPSIPVNQVGIALPVPAGYVVVVARCVIGDAGGNGTLNALVASGIPNTFDFVQTFGFTNVASVVTIPPFAVSVFCEAPAGQIITINNGITSWQAQPGSPVRVGLQGFSTLNVTANVAFTFCPLLWQVRR